MYMYKNMYMYMYKNMYMYLYKKVIKILNYYCVYMLHKLQYMYICSPAKD